MTSAGPAVRVLLYLRAPEAGPEAIRDAYEQISTDLDGTPGLLGNELWDSVLSVSDFAVLSEWVDMAAFSAWEQGPGHRGTTSPLRPYQDRERTPHYAIYQVAASF